MSFRLYVIVGWWIVCVMVIVIAVDISKSTHEVSYREYREVYTYSPVIIDLPEVCSFNATVGGEVCYDPRPYTTYNKTGSIQVPIESTRIEKILDFDGSFREIKNSYSKNDKLSVWSVPLVDLK